jgi:5-methylcytosine-specific restriction enzyme A
MASRRVAPLPGNWKTTRRRILDRDNHQCTAAINGQRCPNRATDVDHVVPAHQGGTDDDDNLASLCDDCHKRKTGAEASRVWWAKAPRKTRKPEPHPGLM